MGEAGSRGINLDLDSPTAKDELILIRDQARCDAQSCLNAYILSQHDITTTTREIYAHASEAVAADFLLRVLNLNDHTAPRILKTAIANWTMNSPGTYPIHAMPTDKKTPFNLPPRLRAELDAALHDPANVLIKVPTKASKHIDGLDEHNGLIGRRTFLRRGVVATGALALAAAGAGSLDNPLPPANKSKGEEPSVDTQKDSLTLVDAAHKVATVAGAASLLGTGYLIDTHIDADRQRRTIPEIVRQMAEIIGYNNLASSRAETAYR